MEMLVFSAIFRQDSRSVLFLISDGSLHNRTNRWSNSSCSPEQAVIEALTSSGPWQVSVHSW